MPNPIRAAAPFVAAIVLALGCNLGKPVPEGQQQRIEMIQKAVYGAYAGAAKHLQAYPEKAEMFNRSAHVADRLMPEALNAGNYSGLMEAVNTKLLITTMVARGNQLVEEADRDPSKKQSYVYAVKSISEGAIEVERLAEYNPSWSKFSPNRK